MTVDRHAAANCQNLVESVVEQPTAGRDGDLLRWLSTDWIIRLIKLAVAVMEATIAGDG